MPLPQVSWSGLPSSVQSTWATDNGLVWLLLENGTLLKKSPSIASWTRLRLPKSPPNFEPLGGFATSAGTHVWVVGTDGVIFHSLDQGQSWTTQASGTVRRVTSVNGNASGSLVVAVLDEAEGESLLWSSDFGKTWTKSPFEYDDEPYPFPLPPHLVSIAAVSSDSTTVFGIISEEASGTTRLVESRDKGASWRSVPGDIEVGLDSRGFCGSASCWFATGGKLVLSKRPGSGWSSTKLPGSIFSIHGNSDGSDLWGGGYEGAVLRSIDGGDWIKTSTSRFMDSSLSWIRRFESGAVSAMGGNGFITSIDDGRTWEFGLIGPSAGVLNAADLHADYPTQWAGGQSGRVWKSVDGVMWSLRIPNDQWNIWRVRARRDSDDVWVVGSNGLAARTRDGGDTWRAMKLNSTSLLRDIRYLPSSRRYVVIGSEGDVLVSTDASGDDWRSVPRVTAANLRCLHATSDGQTVWAVGDGGTIIRSTDGGSLWSPLPSGTTADLYAISGDPVQLKLLAVGAGGTILRSADKGESWVNESLPGLAGVVDVTWGPAGSAAAVTRLGRVLWSGSDGHWVDLRPTVTDPDEAEELWNSIALGSDGILAATDEGVWTGVVEGVHAELLQTSVASGLNGLSLTALVRFDSVSEVPREVVLKAGTAFNAESGLGMKSIAARPVRVTSKNTEEWVFDVEPAAIGARAGDAIRFEVALRSGEGMQSMTGEGAFSVVRPYPIPPVVFDRWGWWRQNTAVVAPVGLFALWLSALGGAYALRPRTVLAIYESDWMGALLDASGPKGLVLVFRGILNASLLPMFVRTHRVLDSWVEYNRDAIVTQFIEQTKVRGVGGYVPLPVSVASAGVTYIVEQPSPEMLRSALSKPRVLIQVVGPGGVGKTTLACAIADWGDRGDLAAHRILPLWISENTDDLLSVIEGKLKSAIGREIPRLFILALLKRQRLLVVFDGLSERDELTVQHVSTIHRDVPANLLVVTSRKAMEFDGVPVDAIGPQPLDERSLVRFVSTALSVDENAKEHFGTVESQIDLALRIARVLESSGVSHRTKQITPLVAEKCIRRAIALVRQGLPLDDLPRSVPAVYLDYVRDVARVGPPASVDDLLAASTAAAALAVGDQYVPRAVKKRAVLAAASEVMAESVATACLDALLASNVIAERQVGAEAFVQFTHDPVCEYLAAMAMAHRCGSSDAMWTGLLERVNAAGATGFETALVQVWHVYGTSLGWSDVVPEFVDG
jgi:photosystem II stability/assembly factor-like uncharacterized protein